MTVAATRTIDNNQDVARKIPSASLSPALLRAGEGVVLERLAGTNATPIALAQPIAPGTPTYVLAFITASGLPATLPDGTLLTAPAAYTVVESNVNGVGEITPTGDQSLNTLLVAYSPAKVDETTGGQTTVG
jgi:hypothetical protein